MSDDFDARIPDSDSWSPWHGLCRGILFGLLATMVLVLITGAVTWRVPTVTMHWFLRSMLTLFMTWVVTSSVQRGTGSVGTFESVTGVLLGAVILISHHIIWAVHGFPTREGWVVGWSLLHPESLLLLSGPAMLLGGGFGYLLCKDGISLSELFDSVRFWRSA